MDRRKPELRITESVDEIPTQGICSFCPNIQFSTGTVIGTAADNQAALELLFASHFADVHLRHNGS